jgi:hypothetical protein
MLSLSRTIRPCRALEDFRIIIDETTNPVQVRNQKRLIGNIYLIPVDAAEEIQLNIITINGLIQIEEAA